MKELICTIGTRSTRKNEHPHSLSWEQTISIEVYLMHDQESSSHRTE